MAYVAAKPAGDDTIAESDTTIRANFAQIVANITNQHKWDNSDATKVVHYRKCGILERDMESATDNVDTDVGFPPTLVIFDYQLLNGTAVEIYIGHGYYDGTDNKNIGYYAQTADTTSWGSISEATNAIFLRDDASNHQGGICSFTGDNFRLAWTKTDGGAPDSPTGTAYIRYTAFG